MKRKDKKIIGVIGLGYVGLPLLLLMNKKFKVYGFDIDKKKIDLLKKNQSYISKTIVEPDKGIYDALNKGIKNATGNIICLVHSGDKLNKNYFDVISEKIEDYDYLYGNINLVTKKNNKLLFKSKKIDKLNNNILDIAILHPGLYIPTVSISVK